MIVVVVFVLAGLAVLGAVVVLAMGRGGELAETHPDYPQLPLGEDGGPVTGDDAAYVRLPRTFWGYQPQLTDEALHRLADALHERDARVAALEEQLMDLRHRSDEAEPVGALHGLEEPAVNGTPPLLRKETLTEEPVDDGLAKEDSP
ncbi:DivIVA domain-containing protein [Actinomadura sp. KC345]|uniref:DivIVA domain-containing protein n=1 Tax=Actinomadura sp. KC345 TaxID=2530371 RepID=UPI001043C6A6|nr:DivIVA domain-containing protein [Actinomadura sp. KC345]TDC58269.1 DivIVA domain-containing protein [Actinomadura sp. KC345]